MKESEREKGGVNEGYVRRYEKERRRYIYI